MSFINKLEDFWVWDKTYIPFISPKDYTNDISNNRHKIAFTLGFDLSKNRNQGRREALYCPLNKNKDNKNNNNPELELTYKTEDKEYIKKNGKKEFRKGGGTFWKSYKPINFIKEHYNSQTHKSKIEGIYKEYIENKKLCKDLARINKVVAFSRHPKTDVIAIDIDCHSDNHDQADDAFNFIRTSFQNNIIYSEISVNGGYHIFFKTDDPVENKDLVELQKAFRDRGFTNVDVIGSNNQRQLLQYIDSPTYLPFRVSKDGFTIPLTEKQYTNGISKFRLKGKIRTIGDIITKIDPIEARIKEEEEKLRQAEEYTEKMAYVPIFSNRENLGNIKSQDIIVEELRHKYPYSAGERVDYMKKLSTICKNYGLNEDQYLDIVLSNNQGSRDLAKWYMQKTRGIYSAYYRNEKYYSKPFEFKHKEEKFYSNQQLVDENQYLRIYVNHLADQFTSQYIKKLKYKKWVDEYKRIIPLLIKEIIGTIIYDTRNKKQKNPQSTLSVNRFNQLLKGTQITNKQLQLFKKYYDCKIDVFRLANEILRNTLFKQFMVNNLGYCFNNKYKFSRIWMLQIKYYNEIIKDIIKNILKYFNDIKDNKQVQSIMQIVYDTYFGLRPDGTSKFFRNCENST